MSWLLVHRGHIMLPEVMPCGRDLFKVEGPLVALTASIFKVSLVLVAFSELVTFKWGGSVTIKASSLLGASSSYE